MSADMLLCLESFVERSLHHPCDCLIRSAIRTSAVIIIIEEEEEESGIIGRRGLQVASVRFTAAHQPVGVFRIFRGAGSGPRRSTEKCRREVVVARVRRPHTHTHARRTVVDRDLAAAAAVLHHNQVFVVPVLAIILATAIFVVDSLRADGSSMIS